MKRIIPIAFGMLGLLIVARPQSTDPAIEKALAAAPKNMRDAATVIKWKPDFTYETLKKGTNQLVCYDRADQAGRQPFAVQCTSLANLPRVAQNRKFEAIPDRAERQKAIEAAEKDGTRVKPEYGSTWIMLNGPDAEHATFHRTIAVPGGTAQSTGLPDKPTAGGAWVMNAGTTTAHIMIPGT
jgi:hypothetical protein